MEKENSKIPVTAPPYHVQSNAMNLRDGFPYFTHHDSVTSLWSNKWRGACAAGIYPFIGGKVVDFDAVFFELQRTSNDDPSILYRPDEYARPFFPVAHRLLSQAEDAGSKGSLGEARDCFLRAAAVFRIARFPINRSPLSQKAWQMGKVAYEKGGRLLNPPIVPIEIPFSRCMTSAGDRDDVIQAYLRAPTGRKPETGWPLVLIICGLDSYRTDQTIRTQEHVNRGCATLSFEIPGTGDCPAAPNDPDSAERLIDSVLDWVTGAASTFGFDLKKVMARGVSTGSYYAFRAAHSHSDRLLGVVAQGGGCHFMFDSAWIGAQNQMEYPFALADALAYKFGYRDADSRAAIARYASESHKFSLVKAGILEKPSCKLLIINGMEDSIFPIEDSIIAAMQGTHKDLVLRGDRRHMGEPGADEIVYRWVDSVLAETS